MVASSNSPVVVTSTGTPTNPASSLDRMSSPKIFFIWVLLEMLPVTLISTFTPVTAPPLSFVSSMAFVILCWIFSLSSVTPFSSVSFFSGLNPRATSSPSVKLSSSVSSFNGSDLYRFTSSPSLIPSPSVSS